ncbi:hypothetical protein K227x_63620 [Rubripirellula lacrimiformis]|uniref:Uncharacterized protein n=1 Tax=Rubripirellula lacrimiformis TaxID=1930273 RepID=A0A517NLI9_9BACT|nr:hypothetical protein K227x_63620 [Rubripirellula lacrimiformis]
MVADAVCTEISDEVSTRVMQRLHDVPISTPSQLHRLITEEAADELVLRFGDGPSQQIIEELLGRWEETGDQGEPIPLDTLCQDHPELRSDIERRIAALKAVQRKPSPRKKRKRQSAPKLPPLDIASVIGDLNFLSAGGLGEVYVGQDDALRRSVAVKFMHRVMFRCARRLPTPTTVASCTVTSNQRTS